MKKIIPIFTLMLALFVGKANAQNQYILPKKFVLNQNDTLIFWQYNAVEKQFAALNKEPDIQKIYFSEAGKKKEIPGQSIASIEKSKHEKGLMLLGIDFKNNQTANTDSLYKTYENQSFLYLSDTLKKEMPRIKQLENHESQKILFLSEARFWQY